MGRKSLELSLDEILLEIGSAADGLYVAIETLESIVHRNKLQDSDFHQVINNLKSLRLEIINLRTLFPSPHKISMPSADTLAGAWMQTIAGEIELNRLQSSLIQCAT